MAASTAKLPAYAEFVYGDIYNNPKKSAALDRNFSVKLHTFFQSDKLLQSLLREVAPNQRVLQLGLTFGPQLEETAMKVGAYGVYDVVDINPLQIDRVRRKCRVMCPYVNFIEENAATFASSTKYDVVILPFLLKELPIVTKTKVVNNALSLVGEGGKVVFIDYHEPIKWHPLRYWLRMYNRLYHPFAEKLWDRQIDTFAKDKIAFSWRKSLFFGGMYQKVVATRKKAYPRFDEAPVKEDFFFNEIYASK